MNLNPLKKDDNTDALVKALEDANATDGTQNPVVAATQPAVAADSATIAADPQVVSSGATPVAPDTVPAVNDSISTEPPANDLPVSPVTQPSDDGTADTPADAASGIAFSGNDLPAGLSSDADAHLDTPSVTEGSGDNGELDTVKNSALEQLRPLIEKLDLEPADKFDKYLMMLRASDDPALIKPAFDTAQAIEGEKEKAQALLDIINEINYISSNQQQS